MIIIKWSLIVGFLKNYNKEINSACGIVALLTALISVVVFFNNENKRFKDTKDIYAYRKVIQMYADKNNAQSIMNVKSDILSDNLNKPDVAMYYALKKNKPNKHEKRILKESTEKQSFSKSDLPSNKYKNIIKKVDVNKKFNDSSILITLSNSSVSNLYKNNQLKITCYDIFIEVQSLIKKNKINGARIYIQDSLNTILAISDTVGGFKYIGLG